MNRAANPVIAALRVVILFLMGAQRPGQRASPAGHVHPILKESALGANGLPAPLRASQTGTITPWLLADDPVFVRNL